VLAIIFGKFIYTPRSSQPMGIGLIAFIRATPRRRVRKKNQNSIEMSLRLIAFSKLHPSS
jgi:hypothetical protein